LIEKVRGTLDRPWPGLPEVNSSAEAR